MRRSVVAGALAIASLAACGGSGAPSKPASTAPTTSPSGEEKAYADATLASLIGSTPKAARKGLELDMECLSTAIVEGIGVDRMKAAGVTPAKLRDPNFAPPARIGRSMSTADKLALAAGLQECGIGRMVGSQTAVEFANDSNPGAPIDRAAVQCIGRGFDGPAARPMIAGMMLNDATVADSERLARLVVGCLDMAPLLAHAFNMTFSAAEDRCVRLASRTDPNFMKLLADGFRGVNSDPVTALGSFGPVLRCLTPAHLAQLGKAGG